MATRSFLFAFSTLFLIASIISSAASGQQKRLVWELMLGDTTDTGKESVLYQPIEVVTDAKQNIFVLQKGSVEKFDRKGNHLLTI